MVPSSWNRAEVTWSLSTLPAIFGKDITLTCKIEIKSKDCRVRQWSGGPGGKAIMYNGITSKRYKYQESVDLQSTSFSLIIKSLLESDVNVNYTCSCDFKSFKKKLVLKEKLFYYPPTETDVSFFYKRDVLKVSLELKKVYPIPSCAFYVGTDLKSDNMTVTFHHNGLVFNANYAIEYTIRNNEEECEKQPLVKCIFISTDKVITMNGNSTVPCPVFDNKSNGSTNVQMFNHDDLSNNTKFPYQILISVCGTMCICVVVTLIIGEITSLKYDDLIRYTI
ncbi:unnamed protein product [Mytilus edulis]|uniref:Ig-like domain-containing protein n=1 Tax=Mytilus edulis TaxID=6550 RepID=A0A8S3VB15_MYTED|nr:unnamed protein product [Mytilus edulis]